MWAGIALIALTGLIHLVEAPDNFEEAAYKGMLFVLNALGAVVAAIGIYRNSRTWGWTLGALVAGGAIMMYIISRTVGLPGLGVDDAWLESSGVAALLAEFLFLAVYAYATMAQPKAAQLAQR